MSIRSRMFFKLFIITLWLGCGVVLSKEPTAQEVTDAFNLYKKGADYKQFIQKSRGTIFDGTSAVICFATQYNPTGLLPEVVAKIKKKIITEGFGVGGLSNRKATPIEYNAAMAILKGIALLLDEEVMIPQNQHQVVVFKALETFKLPLKSEALKKTKEMTDKLDTITNVGTPNNTYITLATEIVGPSITFNSSLYQRMLFSPLTLDKALSSLQEQFTVHTQKIFSPLEKEEKKPQLKLLQKLTIQKKLMEAFPEGMNFSQKKIKELIDSTQEGTALEIQSLLLNVDFDKQPPKHQVSDDKLAAFEIYAKTLYGKVLLTEEQKLKREAEKILFETSPYLNLQSRQRIKVLIDSNSEEKEIQKELTEKLSDINFSEKSKHEFSDEEIAAFETYAKTLYGKVLLTQKQKLKREAEKILFETSPYLNLQSRQRVKVLIDSNSEEEGIQKELTEKLSGIDFSGKPKHEYSDKELATFETYAKTLYKKALLTQKQKLKREAEKILFEAFPHGMYRSQQIFKELIDKQNPDNAPEILGTLQNLEKEPREAFEAYIEAIQ